MDFSLPPEVEDYRRTIRKIVAESFTAADVDRMHATGTFDAPRLNLALAERGFLERAVPGLGKGDPIELWVLFNELEKASAPIDGLAVALMIAGVVNAVGTDEQKARIIPSIVSGEALVCMGYSEPDHGSDVAGITTRAVRDGDEWVINGAKMWTTMAHEATWLILLTRTDTELPKHKGLTMFILPMDTPGITVEAVHTMATERTNATWYDDVRVGDDAVLGEVNGGWRTMTVALAFERGVMGGTNAAVPLLRHFRHWAAEVGLDRDPAVREQMARSAIDMQVATLLTQRSAWIAATGGMPGLEGSMTKVFASEAYQRASKAFQEIAGPAGLLQFHEPGAAAHGFIEYDARHAPVTTIYGGTTEINRNNIAERHLGLPKARR
ncbi:MAG: acyl-CoA dehydrogenase family protein [Acidimicrobiales bacterium]|jgi:alkylation response protein AidB-like acyl-CoA dehydrogenase|nr:acyl-CoA dehydrogenase family protein [Acidimicrobiales bacterium]